jgi:hypothetical protein
MDPISAAILAAVVAGATAGITDAAKTAIGDAYNALKAKIKEKLGAENKLTKAVANLDDDPESPAGKAMVQEKVAALKADQDQELLALANKLTEVIQKGTGQSASAIVNGAGVIVQGNNNQVVGARGVMVGGSVGGSINTGTQVNQKAGDHAIQVGQAHDVNINKP